ncbi:universal stress protein [Kitasatospora griseola]|uniref:universal stress protein n=1 Tax=Kitasatospora griseola TaxID=2064 RepID=UPI003661E9C9
MALRQAPAGAGPGPAVRRPAAGARPFHRGRGPHPCPQHRVRGNGGLRGVATLGRQCPERRGGARQGPGLLEAGPPAWVLLSAARERAGLLAVGHRGLGGFEGALLGSVGQYCVQHSPYPVVVVRTED